MKRTGILIVCSLATLQIAAATFAPPPNLFARRDYTGLNSQAIAVADVNGDAIPDLIANSGGTFQILLGTGSGGFRFGASVNTGVTGIQFLTTDLNKDGKADLVISAASGSQGGIAVCLGNGNGTFQSAVLYPAGGETAQTMGSLVVGDFNGDGIPDIAVSGASGVWLFTGRGDGTLNNGVVAVPLVIAAGSALSAADFNADNKLDLAVALTYSANQGMSGGFVVVMGNGDGSFQPPQTFAQPKQPVALVAGMLTRGGFPGIAVSSGSSVYLYYGNGAGAFSGPRVVTLPGIAKPGSLAVGDINGDGIPDLVSATGFVALGAGGGTFMSATSYAIDSAGTPYSVSLASLRGNGLMDIVTDSSYSISVLLNLGNGRFEDGVWTSVGGSANCAAVADFNGDGKPDLALNTPSAINILLGTGNASTPFTQGQVISNAGTMCVLSGDLNGDAIPDLVVTTPTALLAYLGHGDGTFTQASSTPINFGSAVLADFNHDGKLDFATTGNLLALGNGDGTFQTPAALVSNPPSSGFSGIAAGDMNNDGWPDLVLTNSANGGPNAYVLLNNQNGGFTQVPASFGSQTSQAILTDLNGDGNLDLVLSGTNGTNASLYFGNGQGGFAYVTTLGCPAAGQAAYDMVADLNGDGIPDVAVMGANTVSIFLGRGGANYAAPFALGLGPDPGMMFAANLHGQLPTAGLPDIVAPDYSGGVIVLVNLTK